MYVPAGTEFEMPVYKPGLITHEPPAAKISVTVIVAGEAASVVAVACAVDSHVAGFCGEGQSMYVKV